MAFSTLTTMVPLQWQYYGWCLNEDHLWSIYLWAISPSSWHEFIIIVTLVIIITENTVENTGIIVHWLTRNVALASSGTTCTSSSDHQNYDKECALDASLSLLEREWISDADGPNSWLKLTFPEKYTLIYTRLMQRVVSVCAISELKLEFDDYSTQVRITQ